MKPEWKLTMKSPRLTSMLLTDLPALRGKVGKVIAKRVAEECAVHIAGENRNNPAPLTYKTA
jgi:hypothetical protein